MVNLGKKKSKKTFTEKELVNFGNYLFSRRRLTNFDARTKKLGQHREVWDNDIRNWQDTKGIKFGKK